MTRAAMRTQGEAERRYPVRLRIAVPPEGFGRQLDIMHAWLDETCGAKGWATAPAGTTGVVNDALALYFEMPPLPCPCLCRSLLLRLSGRDDCRRLRDPRRHAADAARRARP